MKTDFDDATHEQVGDVYHCCDDPGCAKCHYALMQVEDEGPMGMAAAVKRCGHCPREVPARLMSPCGCDEAVHFVCYERAEE